MILDKFVGSLKLNPDDEYDEDYELDEFDGDDEYETKPKKKVFAKQQPEETEEYYDEPAKTKPVAKVTPMKQQPKRGVSGMEVCVIKPTTVDDAREITDTLLANRTVVLNMEGLDVDVAQRIIDFTSGSCYAMSGNLQKISHYIFIITPKSVDISGDFQDYLAGGALDISSVDTGL